MTGPVVDTAAMNAIAERATRNRKQFRSGSYTDNTLADLWQAIAQAARELATITL